MPTSDPIREVYEKYKHLDAVLSGLEEVPVRVVTMHLWLAIKAHVEAQQPCVWTVGDDYYWYSSCGGTTTRRFKPQLDNQYERGWSTCPFCSHPIEVHDAQI